jgi:hypothetical protein
LGILSLVTSNAIKLHKSRTLERTIVRAYLRKMFLDMQKEVSRIVGERAAEKAAKLVEETKSPLTQLKKVVMLGDLRQGSIK